MRTLLVLAATLAFVPGAAPAQHAPSSYAGQEGRSVRALSPEQTRAYLTGEGSGFALAAELNHYPGPRHVLERADSLRLAEPEVREVEGIFAAMRDAAIRSGRALVDEEARLDSLFATGGATEDAVAAVVATIARLEGEIRFAHLRAHILTRGLLTEEQVARYDALRGYGHGGEHGHPPGTGAGH